MVSHFHRRADKNVETPLEWYSQFAASTDPAVSWYQDSEGGPYEIVALIWHEPDLFATMDNPKAVTLHILPNKKYLRNAMGTLLDAINFNLAKQRNAITIWNRESNTEWRWLQKHFPSADIKWFEKAYYNPDTNKNEDVWAAHFNLVPELWHNKKEKKHRELAHGRTQTERSGQADTPRTSVLRLSQSTERPFSGFNRFWRVCKERWHAVLPGDGG